MPSVTDFKQAIRSGVIRQHRWQIIPNFPAYAASNEVTRQASLLARTTTLPTSELGEIDLKWGGRDIPIPGDRVFAEIPVTFIGVQDMEVLNAFEIWQESINGSTSNTASATAEEYSRDVVMQLLDDQDNVLKEYVLEDAWIKNIQGMELDKGANDSYAEFTVTFRFLQTNSNTTR